jgi:hypothetical protein
MGSVPVESESPISLFFPVEYAAGADTPGAQMTPTLHQTILDCRIEDNSAQMCIHVTVWMSHV